MRTVVEKSEVSQPAAGRDGARARRTEAGTTAPAPAVQRKSIGTADPSHATVPVAHDLLQSPGRSLDPATRAFLEQRMEHNFGAVRVHSDGRADDAARAVDARAFTLGQDIVFGRGEYRPGTTEGTRLLAHELAHVVQQRRGVSIDGGMGRVGDGYERQADAVADAVVAGRPAATLLGPDAGRGGGGVAIQRQPAPAAAEVPPAEEPVKPVTEGDRMRQAVIGSAETREKDQTTIMSQEDIDEVRKSMVNYTTCVEFAGQTFAEAINVRSKALGRSRKETVAAGRGLSDAKRTLDAEYQLQAEIDGYKAAIKLNEAALKDTKDRRGKETPGVDSRLDAAVKEQARLTTEQARQEGELQGLEAELAGLEDSRKASAGDKDLDKAFGGQINDKKQQIQVKKNALTGTRQLKIGQGQMVKALESAKRAVMRQVEKLVAKIDARQGKLDTLHEHHDMLVRPTPPLTTHPKRGEYILLGAGSAQGYGVSAATTVTLGKGAFKHIAVFDFKEDAPSPPDKPNEKWELWHTIDGGGITPDKRSIKICLDDLRVAPGESKTPWFASKTTLIGWIDMDKLFVDSAPAKPAAAAPAAPPVP